MLVSLVVPLALWTPLPRRRRVLLAAVAAVVAMLTIMPWSIYNVARFHHPVVISTALDTTLAGANCRSAYYGAGIGYWTESCFADINARYVEESDAAAAMRHRTQEYVRGHLSRVPLVAAVRFARIWGLYHPSDIIGVDVLQSRPRSWSWLAYYSFFVLVALSVVGAVVLHRRRVPTWPLVAMLLTVGATAVLFYGNTRFRVPAEIVVVVLSAVALTRFSMPRSATRADAADAG